MRCTLLALALAAALVAQEGKSPTPDNQAERPARTISISAERFAFSPSKIKLKQGEVVEFVITSDDTDRGFRIPEAGIDAAIPQQGKGELRIRFVARDKGEYVFECSRPCGAGHNIMRGTIVVK